MKIKLFVLATLSVFVSCFNCDAYAQEGEFNTAEHIQEEESIFSRASDKQLSEAESFYKSCTQNESMSKRKNCKCAATKYLEARIELGDKATESELILKNVNKCLKDKKYALSDDTIPDISKITDKQREEAEAVFAECKKSIKMSRYYDCECYAARYLDERIKQGPLASKEEVANPIYNECRNIVESTGWEYSRCMKKTAYKPIKNIESKKYCECYARKWGALFKAYQGVVNVDSKRMLRRRATAYCKRPENYD